MMNKSGILALVAMLSLLLIACESNQNATGLDIIPEYQKGEPISENFSLTLESVVAGTKNHSNNIYVSSSRGYLGRMSNDLFGGIETEYLTQFYMPNGFRFQDEAVITKIDSVRLNVYYDGFAGDTISNMTVTVNRVAKPLKHEKYSITEIADYIGEELGSLSYWAGRGSGKVLNSEGQTAGFVLSIPLSTQLGQDFLEASKDQAHREIFANQNRFDNWFSGVYLHTTAGQGSVIRVARTELSFYYTKEVEVENKTTKKKEKKAMPFAQTLIHTSEVPQLSRFQNYGVDHLLNETGYATIKAPSALWIKAVIPTKEIAKRLKEAPKGYTRTLNSVTYTMQGEMVDNSNSTAPQYSIPRTLLMLPTDRAEQFFEKELTENAPEEVYSSFLGEIVVAGSATYHFGNIGSVIQKHIESEPNKDLEVYIIPVERITGQHQQGGGDVFTISLSHLVTPSAVKFAIKNDNTKLEATIIQRHDGKPF